MITKFKIYEAVNKGEPEVGDYVIAKIDDFGDLFLLDEGWFGNIEKIINNNIGILVNVVEEIDVTNEPFCVKYPGADFGESDNFEKDYWWFSENDIIYWSKNKEELEEILATKKYNL